MTNKEIIRDVKATLGLDIEGVNVRSEIQDALRNVVHPFKIYQIGTGVGKTKPSIEEMSDKKCLIACSQLLHIENWKKEVVKWSADDSKWEFTAYNSLHKYKDIEFDYLCLDEGQKSSELRTDWIQEIKYKNLLVLSATIPYDVMQRLRSLGTPKVFKIPIQKAIDWGVLPKPSIKVINCNLDNNNPYLEYSKGKDKKKKTVKCTYQQYTAQYKYIKGKERPNLKIQCTEHEYHNMIIEQFESYDYILKANGYKGMDHIFTLKRNLGARRKEFFSNCKTKIVKKILDKHKSDRCVVFLNTISQANEVAKYLGVEAVHSKANNTQETVDKFNNKVIDKFVAVKQADEAMNLVDPDVSIITQLSGTDTKNISVQNDQRLGRGIRAKDPIFYIPVFWNTQDHEYFNKFYETKDSNMFEFINYNKL